MKKMVLQLLQACMRLFARLTIVRYKPTIIGVTGTVGKTSAKQAIGVVVGVARRTRYSMKSFNNELGLPLTIIGDWEETGGILFWLRVVIRGIVQLIFKNKNYPEVLVLEYGIDRPGDMKYLLSIARPHIGIFTAMGEMPVHVEFFLGPEAVLREKAKLIQQLPATGFAVLNSDDPLVMSVKPQTRAHVVTAGFDHDADMRIMNFSYRFDAEEYATTFKLTYGGSFVPIRLEGVLGRTHAYAAAIGASLGLIFGINLVTIAEAFQAYEAPRGRLKIIPGIKETVIIDDTYNASPIAMEEALEVLKTIDAKRKIAVLGDMLELGKYTLEAHQEIGRRAAHELDMLVTVGLRGKFIAESALRAGMSKKAVTSFMSVREAGHFVQNNLQKGDVVLIKASQAVRLERIVKEIMREPERAKDFLVRQNKEWVDRPALYE